MAQSGESGAARSALVVLLSHSVLVQAVTFVMRPTSTYRAPELGVPAIAARRLEIRPQDGIDPSDT